MLAQARRLRLQQAAASLAFLTLLAAVPIVSIGLAVLAALPVFGRLRDDLQSFLYGNLFPEAFNQIVIERLNEFAERAGSLSSIGALAFFLTAVTALRVIERTMNQIWHVRSRRSFVKRLGLYWVVLTLGPLLLAATVGLSTELIAGTLHTIGAPGLRSVWFGVAPWLTGVAVIWLLFMTLPATRVNGWHAFAGTLLSVMMIAALQRALGAYVRQLPTYEVVYGAFAALPLFLIWLFAVWIAFLLGALLAANLRRWREPRGRDRPECAGEAFAQARLVLDALRREPGGRVEGALAISRLREAFAHDVERLDATGVLLEETGYIIRYLPLADIFGPTARSPAARLGSGSSDIWLERWAWRQDPGQLTLRPLFERLWWGGEGGHASNPATELPADFLDQPLLSPIPAIG
jgi:membrane protein